MNEKCTQTITCRECGCRNKVTVYPVVDSAKNPKLKNKILKGDFFVRKCAQCGKPMLIWHDAMYQDVDKGFLIYLTNDIVELSKTMEWAREQKEQGNIPNEIRIRVVQNQNHFKEKIRIFEMGLNDQVIELIKVQLLDTLDRVPTGLSDILCWVQDNGEFEFTLVGDYVTVVGVKRRAYGMMMFKYAQILSKISSDDVQINIEWANEIMAMLPNDKE